MNYEVWEVWNCAAGWCGSDITHHFNEYLSGQMYRRSDKYSWWPEWYSYEGKDKVYVVLSSDTDLTDWQAQEFLEMLLTKKFVHVHIELDELWPKI